MFATLVIDYLSNDRKTRSMIFYQAGRFPKSNFRKATKQANRIIRPSTGKQLLDHNIEEGNGR